MHNFKSYLILSLVVFWLPCFLLKATRVTATGSLMVPPELVRNETGIAKIGAILGQTSRCGKEAKVSIEIAIQDFYIKPNRSSMLYFQDSLNKPVRTAVAGDKLHSNLSRMAMVIWLFVALIITQSYTASLASMLTAQRLEPAITSVEMLKNMNATVGYCNGSFINQYLKDVLLFEEVKVKSYNSTHRYAEALNSGEIAAIFLEVPVAKVFLAQYCKSFIKTGETFKVGGFGFAFHKGFPGISDANKALIHLTENGKLKELEDKFLISEKCVDEEFSPNEESRLSPRSFLVLFELTGGASTIALAIYIIIIIRDFRTSFIKLILAFIKDWQHRMR